MASQIAKYDSALRAVDAARGALARAKSTSDVMKARNEAEAVRTFARLAKDRTLQINAAEIRIMAERRLGEMLSAQRHMGLMAKGGGDQRSKHRVSTKRGGPPSLKEIGIDNSLAHRARTLAKLSSTRFNKFLADWRARAECGETVYVVSSVLMDARNAARDQSLADEMKRRRTEAVAERRPYDDCSLSNYEDGATEPSEEHSVGFRNRREYLEWLLEVNPTSTQMPKTVNSMRKIVAHGITAAVECMMWGTEEAWKYHRAISAMDERIDRLTAESKDWLIAEFEKTRDPSAAA